MTRVWTTVCNTNVILTLSLVLFIRRTELYVTLKDQRDKYILPIIK